MRTDSTSANDLNKTLLSNPYFKLCVGQGYNQGWYDNVIAVDPTNPDVVWAGGIDLFRSDDGGQNFGVASWWWLEPGTADYNHADQHAIVFHPDYDGTTNTTMFVGNDGGVHETTNALAAVSTSSGDVCNSSGMANAVNWTDLNNGYAVSQFYDGAVYPDGATYFAGAQDNGTLPRLQRRGTGLVGDPRR